METVSLIIGILGLIGIIPFLIEGDKYFSIIRYSFFKMDLTYESLDITFDIKSKDKIYVYQTAKIRINKNHPVLILGHHNAVGDNSQIRTRIDNQPIQNKFIKNNEAESLMTYEITDKKIGETIIVEDEFVCELDDCQKNINDDGCQTELFPYKCKYLHLHVIYPKNFIPSNLSFNETIKKPNKTKKIKKHREATTHFACFADNRKQIQWLIKYPKYKHIYSINWRWCPD